METRRIILCFFFAFTILSSINTQETPEAQEINLDAKVFNNFEMDSFEKDKILACGELVHKKFQLDGVFYIIY
jgi:hypothetical protein